MQNAAIWLVELLNNIMHHKVVHEIAMFSRFSEVLGEHLETKWKIWSNCREDLKKNIYGKANWWARWFFQAYCNRGPMSYPSLRWREKSSGGFEFRKKNGFAVQVFRNSSDQRPWLSCHKHLNRNQERWVYFFIKSDILFHRAILSFVTLNSMQCPCRALIVYHEIAHFKCKAVASHPIRSHK